MIHCEAALDTDRLVAIRMGGSGLATRAQNNQTLCVGTAKAMRRDGRSMPPIFRGGDCSRVQECVRGLFRLFAD